MKIKQQPSDFQVDELSDFSLNGGEFSVYRLTKQSIGVPEAVSAIVDAWRIPRRRIKYGGLKDKHAITTQSITIQHGPKKPLNEHSFTLDYLGQSGRAFTAADIVGNRFSITIRDLLDVQLEPMQQAFESVQRFGLPNYFDDQRFGSLGHTREWIAKSWCLGDYERALWLALADTHPDDRSREKQQKKLLQEHWGAWVECKAALSKSHRRSIVTFLADKEQANKPLDFKGAFARINVDLRGLYLSAFQSALWNRAVSRMIERTYPDRDLPQVKLESGPATFPPIDGNDIDSAAPTGFLSAIPLPCARLKLADDDPARSLLTEVVGEEDMELREVRVKYPRDSFFSKSSRNTITSIANTEIKPDVDALRPKRKSLQLKFDLPRGSYATMLIKRLS
jgi:tRNA pseudouridine13 synthase